MLTVSEIIMSCNNVSVFVEVKINNVLCYVQSVLHISASGIVFCSRGTYDFIF